MNLDKSVKCIKGVGDKKEEILNSINIYTLRDMLEYYPRDYLDRQNISKIGALVPGETSSIMCIINRSGENKYFHGKIITVYKIKSDESDIELIWFNQSFMKTSLKIGQTYVFSGKVTSRGNKLQMVSPEYEMLGDKELLSSARIVPIYHLTNGLTQKATRQMVKEALDICDGEISEFMPQDIMKQNSLIPLWDSIKNIHFPESTEKFFDARQRLVFDEFFILQIALRQLKETMQKKGLFFKVTDYTPFEKSLPFILTDSQRKVLDETIYDIENGYTANRLIQGDVGSGKTAVAMVLCYLAIMSGYQSALMAPTEVLAIQHYISFSESFKSFGINVGLLTGSLTKKEKDAIYAGMENGEVQMIIGTHALIQKTVNYKKLALVITDEQHRFGVKQRFNLTDKGENPHVVIMSATPIPRTLALILYGDMDVSIIDSMPKGRQKIDTFGVTGDYRNRVFAFIKKQCDEGRQAYVVCPLIEDSEKGSKLNSVKNIESMLKKHLGSHKVLSLHGKMKEKEKTDIMEQFSSGSAKVLVATTVIEVGINVPNATVMVIENADRFGLAQIHQLRGRVGRGSEKSYCILISDAKSKVYEKRKKAMEEFSDGFKISELDLNIRGSGEFFGTRQHGIPELKIANIYDDREILFKTQEAVNLLTESDEKSAKLENVIEEATRFLGLESTELSL